MAEDTKDHKARPVAFRGGGFAPRPVAFVGPLVFVAILLFWELGSRTGFISAIVLPAPSQAATAFWELVTSGLLWKHLSASLYRLVIGWSFGTMLGLAVGLAAGLFSLARSGLVPVVSALFPIPKIALLPLFIIWFGIGEESKVATILFGTFFPTVISTYGASIMLIAA
jgi:ABC-type nitrate/sulfonate/bicarbonate transport system permease component